VAEAAVGGRAQEGGSDPAEQAETEVAPSPAELMLAAAQRAGHVPRYDATTKQMIIEGIDHSEALGEGERSVIPLSKYEDERREVTDAIQEQYDKDRRRHTFGLRSTMSTLGVKPILSNVAEQAASGSARTSAPPSSASIPPLPPPAPLPMSFPADPGRKIIGEVPAFNPAAAGTPKVWNETASFYNWSNYVKKKFKKCAVQADFDNISWFFHLRPSSTGAPIANLLGPVEPHPDGWFRCPWLPFEKTELPTESSGTHAWHGRAEWETAWHGCKFEGLYSIMYRGRLEPSICKSRGDRYLTINGAPALGVYLFRSGLKTKAYQYSRFVQLFGDGTFWNCVWEVRVDRSQRIATSGSTDQWVQPAESVLLEAIWFCARSHDELQNGWEVNVRWEPLEEANPTAAIWEDTVPDQFNDDPTIDEPISAEPSSAAPILTTPTVEPAPWATSVEPKVEWAE
jgi:hypothetical protein